MADRLREFCGGLHCRFSMLVVGLVTALLAVQLVVDSVSETRQTSQQRFNEAVNLTSVIARSLEKQFQHFNLSELDEILASVRSKKDVLQVNVVDRNKTFSLDGDPKTSGAQAFYSNPLQFAAIEEGKTQHLAERRVITVVEPLLQSGIPVGSVLIKYRKPGLAETVWPIVASKLTGILPILLFGVVIAAVLVSQITKPLSRLAAGARAFSEGNLDQEVKVEGAREIRHLGDAFNDMIGRLKQNIEQIHELAYVDRVTQLPNREFFRKELTRSINRAKRNGSSGALLFIDLDAFKRVNDTMGHDIGDKLLLSFSERIANVLRVEDLIGFEGASPDEPELLDTDDDAEAISRKAKQVLARLGGDEFSVLLSEIREETDAATVSRRIIDAVSEPFEFDGTNVTIGASIGIATFPRDGSDFQTVLKNADMAMYQAKDEGKNTFRYFSEELNRRASNRMDIEADLRRALDSGDELELHYQPKIDCQSGRPKSVEALVRWRHPQKGMVHPLEFIRIAEECGLILPLGEWVLKEACRQLAEFKKMSLDLCVAVNISTQQFERPEFSKVVLDAVRAAKIDPGKLELEITESMAMQNPEKALLHIQTLKGLGIRFAIDDFGTGYSSLSQLSRLPFDVFKIDRTFVDALTNRDDEHGRAIVKTILAMAKSLNYETVAEGVESVSQLEFLTEYGCDFAQGYYFARPMPIGDFCDWMEGWSKKDDSDLRGVLRQGAA